MWSPVRESFPEKGEETGILLSACSLWSALLRELQLETGRCHTSFSLLTLFSLLRESCGRQGRELARFFFLVDLFWFPQTQKLKSHLVRTQSLNILPLKPGVGQYIAIHATLTARDFFLAYFYPSGPFTCIFSKTSPDFFLCWL